MRILHLSDTHGYHRRLRDLPAADVVVHSGDFTMHGSADEAEDFINWLCDLDYRYKLFTCGNHDFCMYRATVSGLSDTVHLLYNSGVEIEGVKFYGVPLFVPDCADGRQEQYEADIPLDTDVLVTHRPPYGILDYADQTNYGSATLLRRVHEIKPRLHLFGHIHQQYGVLKRGETTYSNGAMMNESSRTLNAPRLFEI